MFIEWKLMMRDQKDFLYNSCVQSMSYFTCSLYNNNNNNPFIPHLVNLTESFLRHFTWYIIITPAQAKHCVIPLWGRATSSHLNSLGSIQATRLPLGTVNLFRVHIILPFAITARYQFYTLVRWGTCGVHILLKDVTAQLSLVTYHTMEQCRWTVTHPCFKPGSWLLNFSDQA